MILFPLLIIATEEVFQKKRWYLCTIFVAISLLSNYYFAYMNTLAIGLYFLIRFLFTKDKDKKNIKAERISHLDVRVCFIVIGRRVIS